MATAVTPFPPFALSRDLCLIVAWRIQFASVQCCYVCMCERLRVLVRVQCTPQSRQRMLSPYSALSKKFLKITLFNLIF